MIPPLLFQTLSFVAVIFLLTSVDFSSAQLKTPRIIGGTPAVPGAWPFMASIFAQENATSPPEHSCGGVIWNEDTILTAAHCLAYPDTEKPLPVSFFSVILGQTDISSPSTENTFQVAQVLIYPGWNSSILQNDVGLIKLAHPIDFTGTHSQTACICDPLPVASLNPSACLALGWGMMNPGDDAISPQLMQVDLPLLPQTVCAAKLLGDPPYNSSVNVCTGYLGVGGKDICGGDSGGPLLCQLTAQPNSYSLVGLTSFSYVECGHPDHPSYFTNVATFLPWVEQASGE